MNSSLHFELYLRQCCRSRLHHPSFLDLGNLLGLMERYREHLQGKATTSLLAKSQHCVQHSVRLYQPTMQQAFGLFPPQFLRWNNATPPPSQLSQGRNPTRFLHLPKHRRTTTMAPGKDLFRCRQRLRSTIQKNHLLPAHHPLSLSTICQSFQRPSPRCLQKPRYNQWWIRFAHHSSPRTLLLIFIPTFADNTSLSKEFQ